MRRCTARFIFDAGFGKRVISTPLNITEGNTVSDVVSQSFMLVYIPEVGTSEKVLLGDYNCVVTEIEVSKAINLDEKYHWQVRLWKGEQLLVAFDGYSITEQYAILDAEEAEKFVFKDESDERDTGERFMEEAQWKAVFMSGYPQGEIGIIKGTRKECFEAIQGSPYGGNRFYICRI